MTFRLRRFFFFFTTFEDYIKLLLSWNISINHCELQIRVHRGEICSRDQIWHKINISVSRVAIFFFYLEKVISVMNYRKNLQHSFPKRGLGVGG